MKNIDDIKNGNKNKMLEKDRAIHSWYQFVLGYPPHLVRYYLQKFNIDKNDVCLDPFSGTGTTPVECMKNGIHSIGIEANPMAYFAEKVKTNLNLDPKELSESLQYIYDSALLSYREHNISEPHWKFQISENNKPLYVAKKIPSLNEDQVKVIPKGFISEKPLKKTMILKEIITHIDNPEIRDFFMLSLGNFIVNVAGNVGFGPEVYRTKPKEDICALDAYLKNSLDMIRDVEQFRTSESMATIIRGDSRDISTSLDKSYYGKINCVITSPPYPNEKDYTRSTRLESVLLGFINNRQELRQLKQNLLRSNSRNVFVRDNDGDQIAKFSRIQEIADDIEQKRIALNKTSGFEKLYHKIVRHYFGGMYLHLKSLRPYLADDAMLAYVVGDQMSFFQTYIPTAELLAEIAEDLKYNVEEIELWRTRLATATKMQIKENVLILRK